MCVFILGYERGEMNQVHSNGQCTHAKLERKCEKRLVIFDLSSDTGTLQAQIIGKAAQRLAGQMNN
jgi:hypothetical protein